MQSDAVLRWAASVSKGPRLADRYSPNDGSIAAPSLPPFLPGPHPSELRAHREYPSSSKYRENGTLNHRAVPGFSPIQNPALVAQVHMTMDYRFQDVATDSGSQTKRLPQQSSRFSFW